MGAYIFKINDQEESNHHAIGIDCELKLIYDGSVNEYLPLNMDNMDHFCGEICTFKYFGNVVKIQSLTRDV